MLNIKNEIVGKFKADFLIFDKIIVELKAVKSITDIERSQTINYLKATGYKLGLLINFGQPSLFCEKLINI